MKHLLSIFALALLPLCHYAQTLASSSTKETALSRCSGSAYCSACRNCSRCAHCSSGGTCGVCASYSAPANDYASNKKKARKAKAKSHGNHGHAAGNKSTSNATVNATLNAGSNAQYLQVTAKMLSLRSGPGSTYAVLEKLKYQQQLLLISKQDQWIKVKAVGSGKIGFCSAAYVQ